ncbi:condensation domain-containing protein [Catenuloplanes sp. NPDC051500]|uniref:condensation domain-containing protein n=1 Tax=Catenuloplanes sp. NPDC051500 TaxID=3363959 RepID=UPI0037B4A777
MQDLTSAQHLTARFSDASAGTAPATLGQRNVLAWIVRQHTERSDVISRAVEVPAGTRLSGIVDAVRTLLIRHEGLRTTFTIDAAGEWLQRVHPDGDVTIEVCPDGNAIDPRWWGRPFDLSAEFGVRFAVITSAERPVRLEFAISHVAGDFAAQEILAHQLEAMFADPQQNLPAVRQPREQAADETSPAGLRRAEAGLRAWDRAMRKAPQCMLSITPHSAGESGPRQAVLYSRAAALALDHITARTGASRSTVVFAAYATVLAHRTGHDSCAMIAVSGNRFRLGTRDYVGTIAQDAFVRLDIAPAFDTVVRDSRQSLMTTYRSGQYDTACLYEVMGRMEYERGTRFHRDCVFTDISVHRRMPGAAPRTATLAQMREAMSQTRVTFITARDLSVLCQLQVYELDEQVTLVLQADSGLLPSREIEEFLRGVERLLLAAADRDIEAAELATVSGIAAPVRGPGWDLIDSCWIRPDAVRRLLLDVPGVTDAVAYVRDGSLVGHLVCADPTMSLDDIHLSAVARLRGRLTAMAPHLYHLHAARPGQPDDPAAWQRLPVLAAGTGRRADQPAGRPEEMPCR